MRCLECSKPRARPSERITLLLTSGSRHPYKLDAKYLARRNVAMPDETENGQPDPFSISVYTLKELILREWRTDWEAKPASPSSIRLIYFGKLLDDKEQLKSRFPRGRPNRSRSLRLAPPFPLPPFVAISLTREACRVPVQHREPKRHPHEHPPRPPR